MLNALQYIEDTVNYILISARNISASICSCNLPKETRKSGYRIVCPALRIRYWTHDYISRGAVRSAASSYILCSNA